MSMIPEFDDRGYLPPGLHKVTIDEIEPRFGRESELRRVQMESLKWLVDLIRDEGIKRFVINGSFVTDILEPNDVDCLLLIDDSYPRNIVVDQEIRKGIPFLEIHLVKEDDFDFFTRMIYASDRLLVAKGMVEVVI
jgi:hypothetical protein